MKRILAVAVLVKDNDVLLIHRRNSKEYYVFPGGGVEEGESVEQAVLRELKEETSITAEIVKLLLHINYDDDTENYVYLCGYVSGEPKLDDNAPEKQKMLEGVEYYDPLWVKISDIKNMLVYPLEARDLFIESFKNGFKEPTQYKTFKVSELRKTL